MTSLEVVVGSIIGVLLYLTVSVIIWLYHFYFSYITLQYTDEDGNIVRRKIRSNKEFEEFTKTAKVKGWDTDEK